MLPSSSPHSCVDALAEHHRASVVFLFHSSVRLADWLAKPLIKQTCLGKWAELRPNEGPDKACEFLSDLYGVCGVCAKMRSF